MTHEEAEAIVRAKWSDEGTCRSCGWHSALYELEPLWQWIDDEAISEGKVELPCLSDDDGGSHRGVRIYLRAPDSGSSAGESR